MSLQQIKNLKDQKGFTIVELLIVIVVIGILAAIIIVAYTGVQNQARTTKAKSNASTIQKRLEAYYAEQDGVYPTTIAAWNTWSGTNRNKAGAVPSNITAQSGALTAASDNIRIQFCQSGGTAPASVAASTGYRITWWDYSASPAAEVATASAIHGGDTQATGHTCASF